MLFNSVLGTNATRYVLSGTLTEVENVLQECSELPVGTNDTCHVFHGILTEVDEFAVQTIPVMC